MLFRSFTLALLLWTTTSDADGFAGVVSSATPEATALGVSVLERGGNAIDAAVAVSLGLAVSEPAGSGIAGQTVLLVRHPDGETFVIHGTTWSPSQLPNNVTEEQLRYGHTASSVPSTLMVLDLAQRRYGSGKVSWSELVTPAAELAEQGFVVGPFRQKAFRDYRDDIARQPAAASIFLKADGMPYAPGEVFRQPKLAMTLRRIATAGAADFYSGQIASAIVADMEANGGWITRDDLESFPQPAIVEPLTSTYRGYIVATLPPPFGGWVMLQILNILEQFPQNVLAEDSSARRLALLDAMRIGHGTRRRNPVPSFTDYQQDVAVKISKTEAKRLLAENRGELGGETTHFSVVDAEGWVVAATQSIDSYFGAKVVHPQLGFLYNNYMQGFRLEDDGSPYVLKEKEMVLSSMSGTIVARGDKPVLVLGSPGSSRIISAVAQVTSYWIDIRQDIKAAVGAYRVHGLPEDRSYIEGPEVPNDLLLGIAQHGFVLRRPAYGVADGHLDPYFGGVHAIAFEQGEWVGTADPRRDGRAAYAMKRN